MITTLLGPLKALHQVLYDDVDRAKQTIDEFTRTNPLIFPVRVTYDLLIDGTDEATQTCKAFGGALDNMANSTPIVGHVKGAITVACGNKEKGTEILQQATRTTIVVGAGVGGFCLEGPAELVSLLLVLE